VFEVVDGGDAVVVGLRISQPEWSGSVEAHKVFTFRPGADVVVGMQDCIDREDALSRMGAHGSERR